MDRLRREGGQTDGDALGSFLAWRAVAYPLDPPHQDCLTSVDVDFALVRFDTQQRLTDILGCTIHNLLPITTPTDDLIVLREQKRQQIETLLQTDDRQTLALVAQLLARVSETTPR